MESLHVDSEIYDVLIIGAGPCGLAVASRLREQTPSAMFTDEEQQRYHWIRKHSLSRMSIKDKRTLETSKPHVSGCGGSHLSMIVLDASSQQWMAKWDHLFNMYQIAHLRSPMFFHIDPHDRDGLIRYTHEQGRADELMEIGGCVGQERSKHQRKKDRKGRRSFQEVAVDERDRKDYYTPSTSLFKQHCEEVVDKYGLRKEIIQKEAVADIDFDVPGGDSSRLFCVRTDRMIRHARTVVLSVGAASRPHIPEMPDTGAVGGACHASYIQTFPDPIVKDRIREGRCTSIVVVGGGLTAAHLAVNAIRKGLQEVHMIIRSHLKVKPFDVDLAWMGKFRNLQQAYFWSADSDLERAKLIQDARNGGSVTPRMHKMMKRLHAEGRLHIHEHTVLASVKFDASTQTSQVTTDPPVELPDIDYVYYATGTQTRFGKLPYLQKLLTKYPIDTVGGLPCLSEDMSWRSDVPLFVTGKLAGLRIGPGAGNLAGARIGAERIAWTLQEYLDAQGDGSDMSDDLTTAYTLGVGNRFRSLTGSETDGDEHCDSDESSSG